MHWSGCEGVSVRRASLRAKMKKWISDRWGRIPAKRRAKWWVKAWWFVTILSALSLSTIILNFKDPSQAPVAGAIFTVAAFFWFTRQKAKQDGYAQDAERRLADLNQMHFMNELNAIKASISTETHERKVEDHKLAVEISKQADDLHQRSSGAGLMFLSASSRVKRPSAPPPRISPSPVTRIANYRELSGDLRGAIKEHRDFSGRIGKMEGFSILYGAAISAFGSDFIRWWNG